MSSERTSESASPAEAARASEPKTENNNGLRDRRSWLGNLALTLPFLFLFWINLAHHDLWLDELNAWGISAASPTLRALFANVHYEGHPWLWYFVLWLPSRFTHAPVAMKWVEALIGTAIYLVVGMLSPFSRLQKALVLLSYFVIFEYTVISRTYGLMLLFALLYAWQRSKKPQNILGNLALLGALANTDLTGIMLSGALLLEYLADRWPHRHEIERRQLVWSGSIFAVMLLFSLETLRTAKDISWATTGHLFSKAGSGAHFIHSLADVTVAAWWPFAQGYPHQYWNTDTGFQRGAVLFIPVVLAAYFFLFRRYRSLLLLMTGTLFLALCFAHLVYIGYVRHWGIVVVAFLVALWILRQDTIGKRALPWIAYMFLGISALKGVAAVAASWTHPFSESGNAAAWLRAHGDADLPIVGASDYNLAGVAEQLERPVYFLNCNCIDTYMKFAHRRDGMTPDEVPDRIAQAYATFHAPPKMIMVMDYPLTADDFRKIATEGLLVKPLADFNRSEDHLELHLYEAAATAKQK